jgi:hypothetical protein
MTAVEAFNPLPSDNAFVTYHFDVRRGVYTIEERTNEALVTQRFYAHRRYRNLMVNEIKVELYQRVPLLLETQNFTNLHLNPALMNTWSNPNNYRMYNMENNPDNITYESRLVKTPTYLGKNHELNDGV